ncbi:MAG: class I SAM-dependent methyltransferase [Burkholderiales bacterium]
MADWPEPLPRQDESDDAAFYSFARIVTHIDDAAIEAVTALYREILAADTRVVDLMSSWISHLPADISYAEVVGVGMNAEELAKNRRLDRYVVHDLNKDPILPFDPAYFDAALICVSVDYLVQPTAVLRELGRIVKPGGGLVITFSNRCFPTKVAGPWLDLDDGGRLDFVVSRVRAAGNWVDIVTLDRSPLYGDPLFAVVARRLHGR